MKKLVLAALLWSVASVMAVTAGQETEVLEARGLVKEFFSELKSQLSAAIKAGGTVTAIAVCNVTAPAIARNLAHRSGWEVGRTSLKQRNPTNRPDAWETTVLREFQARKANGEDLKTMACAETVEIDNRKHYRFTKAISASELCLVRHDEAINPAIAAAIDEASCGDEAQGFALGDIRGVFTLPARYEL